MPAESLVVTLRCGGAGWSYCEELRERYFPADRNLVPAHLAMFHQLPAEELALVTTQALAITNAYLNFPMQVSRLRSLGRGVALQVDSNHLLQLHGSLVKVWEPWLIPQDRTRFSPHITIQNKVTPEVARETLRTLTIEFTSFEIEALGVDFWYYRNGPWEHAQFVPLGNLVSPPP